MGRNSLWQATLRGEHYPVLSGVVTVDAAVIGGGIAGVMTAYHLKRAGLKVALVEAESIGHGETGNTTAHLTALTDTPFDALLKQHGAEQARLVWEAGRDAVAMIEAMAHEHGIDCDFERVAACKFASRGNEQPALEAEAEALVSLGIPFDIGAPLPLEHVAALRFQKQGQFHPLKFLYAVAELIPGGGSHVFEKSRVREVSRRRLRTAWGTLRADHLIFTTNYPIQEARIALKLQPYMTYAIAVQGRHELDRELYYDYQDPYHYIRRYGDGVIVGGGDHHTGGRVDPRAHHQHLVDYVRRHISATAEVRYAWSGQVLEPLDGLPYIGKRVGHEYVASGFSGNGMTFGALAGQVIADLLVKRDNRYAEAFSPRRLKGARAFVRHGAHVGREYAARGAELHEPARVEALQPGEGALIRQSGKTIAVSRDEDGQLHSVSALCTHMGCMVRWNAQERSWDCPCHGSRFDVRGEVRAGPAVRALPPMSLDAAGTRPEMGRRAVREAAKPPPHP